MTATADAWFAIVPEYVAYCGNPRAVQVFAIMHRHADKADEAWPSRSTMADLAGCSPDTVDRAVRDLETLGAVTVDRRKRTDGSYSSNLYTLHMSAPMPGGGRTVAARGGRVDAEGVAALARRHDPESMNQSQIEPNGEIRTDARDLIFEAVCVVCGIQWSDGITKTQRGRVNKAVAELKAIGATPEQIVAKAVAYRDAFTTALTPQALVGNWNVVDAAAMSEEQRAKARRAMMETPTGRNLPA